MKEIMYLVTICILIIIMLKQFVLGRNLIVSNSSAMRDTAIINLLTYHVIVTVRKHHGGVRGKKGALTITYQSSKNWITSVCVALSWSFFTLFHFSMLYPVVIRPLRLSYS